MNLGRKTGNRKWGASSRAGALRSESCFLSTLLSFLDIFLPRAQDSVGRISVRVPSSSGESPPPKAPAVVQKSEVLGEGEHQEKHLSPAPWETSPILEHDFPTGIERQVGVWAV